ncbi:MAG TPA: hypothetical protein VEA40_18030 [Ramlibacter sp.]|nr:hypothetical protein [Ramlibacter sp.]
MTTLIAAFPDHGTAQAALEQLARAGVAREELFLEHERDRISAMHDRVPEQRESVLGSLGRVFGDLVQANVDPRTADPVSEALQRGGSVLIARVHAARADAFAEQLRAAGAFNVASYAAAGAH